MYADVSRCALLCAFHHDQAVSFVSVQRDEERIAMRGRMELGSWGLVRPGGDSEGQNSTVAIGSND
jgi:hypothetical protein